MTVSRRLAGRLLLPLPRLEIRHVRSRLQGRAGADEPLRAAVPVRERHPHPDRRREGERVMGTAADKVAAKTGSGRLAALTAWIDERFPLTALWKSQVSEYYAPKNFNVWYYFGSLALFVLVIQILSGHLPDDELQALGGRGVRLRRIHHARRRVGLADPLHPLDRRVGVLHRRLPAHVPRADVRLVPEAARTAVDLRHADLLRADGRGVLRLPAAVGQHVLLGRAGDRVAVRRDPVHRRLRSRSGSAATTTSRTSR